MDIKQYVFASFLINKFLSFEGVSFFTEQVWIFNGDSVWILQQGISFSVNGILTIIILSKKSSGSLFNFIVLFNVNDSTKMFLLFAKPMQHVGQTSQKVLILLLVWHFIQYFISLCNDKILTVNLGKRIGCLIHFNWVFQYWSGAWVELQVD